MFLMNIVKLNIQRNTMSIANEISRIQTAKANIKAAIEAKGGTVTGTIDTFASAINDLQIGESLVYYEYLKGNGTSYILTDYTPNTNTIIEVKFKYNKPAASFVPVVGSRSGYSSAGCLLALTNTAGAMRADLSNNTGTVQSVGAEDEVIIVKADVGQNKVYINGTEKTFTSSSSSNGNWYKLALFTMNTAGTIYSNVYDGDIYYVKVWEGTDLKAYYRPAIYNKTKGMHDDVSGMFYSSANATPFNVGGNEIPSGNSGSTSGGSSADTEALKVLLQRNLTSIDIPEGTTSIGDCCFYYCTGLKSVTIPNSVTSLGGSCFDHCTVLKSITIPNSVTSLGRSCFSYCTGLTSVTIPNSVTSLGGNCFYYCTGLTSVIWNSTQQYIPSSCFYGCASLQKFDLSSATQIFRFGSNTSTTVGGSGYIYIRSGLKIIVPKSLYNDWKASSYWANFVNYLYWRDDDGNLQNTTVE